MFTSSSRDPIPALSTQAEGAASFQNILWLLRGGKKESGWVNLWVKMEAADREAPQV